MKTMPIILCAGAGALALALPGSAQDGPRFDLGAGYSRLLTSVSGEDVDFGAGVLRGTLHFNDMFAIEGEAQVGVNDDEIAGMDVSLDHGLGLFARGGVAATDNLGLFARVGYVEAEVELDAGPVAITDSADGWALGVGGEILGIGSSGGLRADYTYYDFDVSEADGFSLSYFYRFGG